MVTRDSVNVLYGDGELVFGEEDGKYYLFYRGYDYVITDYPYEPLLRIKKTDGTEIIVHNAFSVDELCKAARTGGSIVMISGDRYDVKGIFRLLAKALELSMDSADLSYLEGMCFIDYLEKTGAVSPQTGVFPTAAGIDNPAVLNPMIHSKKIDMTPEGLFYLRRKK